MMGGFVNTVEANYGDPIPTDQAAELLWRGEAVIYVLGSPAGGPGIIPHGDPILWTHQGDEKDHGKGNLVAGSVAELTLRGVYPNPVRGEASVRFALPASGRAEVTLYDVMGRDVSPVQSAQFEAGEQSVSVSAGSLAAGVYVVRVSTGSGAATGKFVVLD